jgi:hypothetical protein
MLWIVMGERLMDIRAHQRRLVAKQFQIVFAIFVLTFGAALSTAIGAYWATAEPHITAAAKVVADFIIAHFGFFVFQISCFVGMLVTGVLLYLFRCRFLKTYGFLEVVVGLATAIYLANNFQISAPTFGPYFAILAALYVIVRGLDNFHKSLRDEKHIELWNRIFFGIKPDKKNGGMA